MKSTIFFLVVIGLVFFLRLNLPANNINTNIQKSSDNIVDQTINTILLSDTVADWQYIDFIVIKFACSENLKIRMIAYPLKRWEIHKKDIKNCQENWNVFDW